VTEDVCPAVPRSTFVAKLTVPGIDVLRKTDTEPPVKFATARSGIPFPSKSPMLTICGAPPAAKSTLAAKLPASIIPGVDVSAVSYCHIGLAVSVKITDTYGIRR